MPAAAHRLKIAELEQVSAGCNSVRSWTGLSVRGQHRKSCVSVSDQVSTRSGARVRTEPWLGAVAKAQ